MNAALSYIDANSSSKTGT